MALLESRIGLQLNGYETVRSPLAGQVTCTCCTCCDRTRAEYYAMQDGAVWCVTTDGTVGVLIPGSDEFQIKHHSRNYFSWRYASRTGNASRPAPVTRPSVTDPGIKGSVMFPYFQDLIGFQVDIDECVIFNSHGDLLYRGYYDGRRFPLMYNGESDVGAEYSQFYYVTTPVVQPLINGASQSSYDFERWGAPGKIRLTAESAEWAAARSYLAAYKDPEDTAGDEGSSICAGAYDWVRHAGTVRRGQVDPDVIPPWQEPQPPAQEDTRAIYDQLGIGLTAVAWTTDYEVPRSELKFCAYTTDATTTVRYSTHKDYACTCGAPADEVPPGDVHYPSPVPVMPRSRVKEAKCRPEPCDYAPPQEVFLCEDREVTKYHACETTFKEGIDLPQQMQGFDLALCGNFVRVVYRSSAVQSNKWYRYVGNVPSKDHLPTFIPKGFVLTDGNLQELLDGLPDPPDKYDQDAWGVPKWWSRFVQTFYVYGAHQKSQHQWMRFEDQERKEIENVKDLNVPGTLADERRQAACDANPDDPAACTPFCDVPGSVERVMPRSLAGITPPVHWDKWFLPKRAAKGDPVGEPTEGDPETNYSDNYGIQRLDVISVGPEDSPDSHKLWYYFTGYAWLLGNGSYQDLKNWATEDLGFVFYRGLENLDQCSDKAQMIPAGVDKLQCCGDYLLVGLNTAFESRMVFFKETKLVDLGLEAPPEAENYQRESFGCCPTFFAYGMLVTSRTYEVKFFNVTVRSDGTVTRQEETWSGMFDDTDNPPPVFVSACESGCRYYFARQNDKKGQYFYRDVATDGTYGDWRHIKSLAISSENNDNVAPASGCASAGNVCYIPCEGAGQSGSTKWYRGAQVSEQCDTPTSERVCSDGFVTIQCEGTAKCHGVNGAYACGGGDEEVSAMTRLRLERCEHYGTPPEICGGSAGLRFNSETISVSVAEAVAWSTVDDCEMTPWVDHISTISSRPCWAAESMGSDDLVGCENTLYSLDGDGAVVDSAVVAGSPDWSWHEDYSPKITWTLGISHRCRDATCFNTCELCKGEEEPGLTFPCRSYTKSEPCHSWTWDWSFGGCAGGVCSHYTYAHISSCANPGTDASGTTEHKAVRAAGTIYAKNPFTGEIVTCDTGLAGTSISSLRFTGDRGQSALCVYSDDTVSTCFAGKSWSAVFTDDNDEITLYRFELDSFAGTMTCETANVPGRMDDNPLWTCERINPGNNILYWRKNHHGCCEGGGTRCGTAVAQYTSAGLVIVDIIWKGKGYRYFAEGVTVTDSENCSIGSVRFTCCGPYTLLATSLYYLDIPVNSGFDDKWTFSGCCGEGAILVNSDTGEQRAYIEGVELSAGDIFQGDPYGAAVNDVASYPLTIDCDGDYYLVSCHVDNEIKWARRYFPDERVKKVREFATVRPGAEGLFDYEFETGDQLLEWWMANNEAEMVLLDGTVCVPYTAELQKLKDEDPNGQVRVGPSAWRVFPEEQVARPSVMNGDREIYPAVVGLVFRDPLAPWWDGGKAGQHSEKVEADSTEGTLSLMRTLLGVDIADTNDYETDPIRALEKQIQALRLRIELNKGLMRAKTLQASALQYAWGMQFFIQALQEEVRGLSMENVRLSERIDALMRRLEILISAPPTEDSAEGGGHISNAWLWGFTVEPGRNIATGFYCEAGSRAPQAVVTDSRILAVKSYCDSAFGAYYFTAAGYYWWDTPLIERRHRFEKETGSDMAGLPTYRIWESHFDLFMGVPNPLTQNDIGQESPASTQNLQQMGNWLNKYQPYGLYVFDGPLRLSDTLDVSGTDDIEPPQPNPIPQLTDRVRPPYNQGWHDANHPYGPFLFINDRHAPVRYDRALSWDKPFEDNCQHDCFKLKNSTEYIRSAVAAGGSRIAVGGNGVVHVFDARLGRMDFNAETLEKIE